MKPVNLHEYEPLAREKLPQGSYDFIAGGADDEMTLRENRAAFQRIQLRPRVLIDVSTVDTSTDVLGLRVPFPVLLAPTAVHTLVHPEGEVASSRAAAAAGTVFVLSSTSHCTFEEVAAASDGPRWFQLYLYGRDHARGMVERAEATGCRAICLTADSAWYGRRERDLRNQFEWPAGVESRLRDEVTDAMFEKQRAVTWDDIGWLRSITSLPLVVKGIVTAEDACLAVEHGVAGIIVSNHGGRQLDSVAATIDALPEVVEAVAGRTEVFMDGGVRRGTDVVKALALGARAVLIGRPYLWALAVDGEAGVRRVLELLRVEIELAMGLCGCRSVEEIGPALLRRPAG